MDGINLNNVIHVKANLEKCIIYFHCTDGNCYSVEFNSKEDTIKAFNVVADKLASNFVIFNKE